MIRNHLNNRRVMSSDLRQRVAPRRGRPRVETPRVVTSVKIPQDVYDAACRQALRERTSVHAVLLRRISDQT